MIKEKRVDLTISASYSTLNSLTEKTKRIWIVFHGYGQLTKFFIKKFELLNPEENYIIAPQGLSKFYLEGFSGRVGANWMTKEDRLTEIDHQMILVDRILEEENITQSNLELNYFGFSQGVATMCRYAAFAKKPFKNMIIWAGAFPPELEAEDFGFLTEKPVVKYFSGKEDPFYRKGMEEEQAMKVKNTMGVEPQVIWFEGVHQVVASLIKDL